MKRAGIISKALGRARQRRRQPMDVVLTLKVNFGDSPGDAVTLLEESRIPLVGSVFENRDRIAREFLRLLLAATSRQPLRTLFANRGERT